MLNFVFCCSTCFSSKPNSALVYVVGICISVALFNVPRLFEMECTCEQGKIFFKNIWFLNFVFEEGECHIAVTDLRRNPLYSTVLLVASSLSNTILPCIILSIFNFNIINLIKKRELLLRRITSRKVLHKIYNWNRWITEDLLSKRNFILRHKFLNCNFLVLPFS